jgi:glutamate-ammonia-ligase adenylyltransferase
LRRDLGDRWEVALHGITQAPEPALAAANLSRLLFYGMGQGEVLDSPQLLADLLFVLGASQFLSTVLLGQEADWERVFLASLQTGAKAAETHLSSLRTRLGEKTAEEDFLRELRVYRNQEFFRIGIRDLLGYASVEATTLELSTLAEAALQAAYEQVRQHLWPAYGEVWTEGKGKRRPAGFVILGMGKLGGQELNFSSDIDLVYLYERDGETSSGGEKGCLNSREFFTRLAQGITRALSDLAFGGRVFRVDLRLRPDGVNGPVVNSLANALLYYESWGQTWERSALSKARPVAGEKELGELFLAEVSPFIYRRYLDFTTVEDIKEMKVRVQRSLQTDSHKGINVKLGRGGIREIEFFTQVLQLIHGGKDPRVREKNTLKALDRLIEGKYTFASEGKALQNAYRFLRHVEHRLQIYQDRQTHTLPTDKEDLRTLARRLRYHRLQDSGNEVRQFEEDFHRHTAVVQEAFIHLFYTPQEEIRKQADEESEALLRELHYEERTLWRLQQLGFRDLTQSYQHLQLLRNGPPHSPSSPRRKEILYTLAPALVSEICHSADPDLALRHMASFIATIGARSSFLSLLLENPSTLRVLVELFGTSEYLSLFFLRHPELLDNLVRVDLVQVDKSKATMAAELVSRLAASSLYEDQLDILRRYRNEEFLRIGINDIHGLLDFAAASRQLSHLAEACLKGAYRSALAALLARYRMDTPPGHLAIIGMGKLGAEELNYNSDLDLIFIYQPFDSAQDRPEERHIPHGLTAHEFFTKFAQRLITTLQVQTTEGYVYKIDTRLRPSGRAGSLVSSLDAFVNYHQTSSQLWERQALIKARAVAGDTALGMEVERVIAGYVYGASLTLSGVAEIHRLRMRMEEELAREYKGRLNIKTGRGGIVDIEFLTQMLQLRHGHRLPHLRQRGTLSALEALQANGILPKGDFALLSQGYRFLRTLENRLRIERDQPVEALERDEKKLLVLARRMGYNGENAATQGAAHRLLHSYEKHREEIRGCYTRWFAEEETPGRPTA